MNLDRAFISDIQHIIAGARERAVRSVNFERVVMYWQIGQRIVEEEQQGQARAEYGTSLIKSLAETLVPEHGSGFSVRQFCYRTLF